MVKRQKGGEYAGVLEFEGRSGDDPDVVAWLAEHRATNGGKIRVSQGAKGVRVAFSKESDMAFWKARSDGTLKAKRPPGA